MTEDFFQYLSRKWAVDCFGNKAASNTGERAHRFIEEALEVARA